MYLEFFRKQKWSHANPLLQVSWSSVTFTKMFLCWAMSVYLFWLPLLYPWFFGLVPSSLTCEECKDSPPKQNIIVWSWLWMLSLWVWPVGAQNSVSWNLVFILEFLCGGHSSLACVVWVHHSAEDASPNPAHLHLQSLMVQAPCSHPFCNCPWLIVLLFVLYTTWNSHRLIHGLQITRL